MKFNSLRRRKSIPAEDSSILLTSRVRLLEFETLALWSQVLNIKLGIQSSYSFPLSYYAAQSTGSFCQCLTLIELFCFHFVCFTLWRTIGLRNDIFSRHIFSYFWVWYCVNKDAQIRRCVFCILLLCMQQNLVRLYQITVLSFCLFC